MTIPHKESVMAHMDELTESARRIGAVNTITKLADGRLTRTLTPTPTPTPTRTRTRT